MSLIVSITDKMLDYDWFFARLFPDVIVAQSRGYPITADQSDSTLRTRQSGALKWIILAVQTDVLKV